MNLQETVKLCEMIKNYYPQFEFSKMKIQAWCRQFADVEMETALHNLDEYVSTEEKNIPPSVARLKRQRGGSLIETDNVLYRNNPFVIFHGQISTPCKYKGDGVWEDSEGRIYAMPNADVEYWNEFYGYEKPKESQTAMSR